VEIAISLVMERKIAEYPLGVCDVENFGDKLFDPIGTIEEAAGHRQMEVLYFIEVYGNVAFHEVVIAYASKQVVPCHPPELRVILAPSPSPSSLPSP
jgi:hypothetical protein